MMAKWYSGILGPKAFWHLSYRWGKTPKKPHPGNLSRPGIESGPAAWQARMLPPIPQRWDSVSLSYVPYPVHTIFHCYTNSFRGLLWHAENSRFFRATLHKNKFNGLESRGITEEEAKGSVWLHKQQVNVLPVQSRSTRLSMLPFVRSFKRK